MVVSIIKELGTWNGRPKRIRKVVEKNFIAMNCCFYVINSVDLRIMAVYNIPFSTLKIANKAGIPCKIRRSRLLTCLKMLYISATLKFF